MLDARCPLCRGHGEWNVEIDLVSFRSKRPICSRCFGAGYVETGNDPVGLPGIELSPEGKPRWVTNYTPRGCLASVDILADDQHLECRSTRAHIHSLHWITSEHDRPRCSEGAPTMIWSNR